MISVGGFNNTHIAGLSALGKRPGLKLGNHLSLGNIFINERLQVTVIVSGVFGILLFKRFKGFLGSVALEVFFKNILRFLVRCLILCGFGINVKIDICILIL